MRIHTLHTEQWLAQPVEAVFAFFADAHNLDRITPPWLRFRILTAAPLVLGPGALLEYRLNWRWLPIRWRTEISVWQPPHRFVDRQIRGPYRRWIHEHTFTEQNGGTLMRDKVEYAVPGGVLEPLVHALLVGPDVRHIFDYRKRTIAEIFRDAADSTGRSTAVPPIGPCRPSVSRQRRSPLSS